MTLELIRELCSAQKLRWTNHIFKRLVQRNINMEDIQTVIMNGEIIENYPDDYPFPSCLIWGLRKNKDIIHVVCSVDDDQNELWLITAYIPDDRWENDFKTRKVDEL